MNNSINIEKSKNTKGMKENVYITGDISPNGQRKRILQVGENLYHNLQIAYKNKSKGPSENKVANIKIIFLEEKDYVLSNNNISKNKPKFSAVVKIWLIYQESLQMFSYVIEIIPTSNSNKQQINENLVKSIISSLTRNIDYQLIIAALKKLGFNINEYILFPDIFKWSFSIRSIPLIPSNEKNNNGPAMPLNNKNFWGLKKSNKKENNNGPAMPLNNS